MHYIIDSYIEVIVLLLYSMRNHSSSSYTGSLASGAVTPIRSPSVSVTWYTNSLTPDQLITSPQHTYHYQCLCFAYFTV